MSRNVTSLRAALLVAFVAVASAQVIPQSAHVNLYFPHLADGGPPESQWQTTFLFSNPNLQAVSVLLVFYDDNGDYLPLDFGEGPKGTLRFSIPANGVRVLKSRVGAQVVTGWAQAAASLPVQGTVQFGTIESGVPKLAVSAESTLPSYRHFYPANFFTSFALGNAFDSASSRVLMRVFSAEGQPVASEIMTIPPSGHVAFTLGNRYPSLGTSFEGTVELISPDFAADFVAWAMRSNSSGVISSLPSGRYKNPASHWDEIWMAFQKTLNAAQGIAPEVFLLGGLVDLRISSDTQINALAANGDTVQINLALAELISDSPSELAFAVAHELGHIYQQRTGRMDFFPSNRERDADLWGLLLTLASGYDPYASAGTLSKLAMATGNSELTKQQFFEDLLILDAHGSFNERISTVFDAVSIGCAVERETCDLLKSILHPHFPASAPLLRVLPPERVRPGARE